MPQFDYAGAIKAGHSENDIAAFLQAQKQKGVDLYIDHHEYNANRPDHNGVRAFINKPTPKVSTGKEFLKGLAPAAVQTVAQGPAKLLTSGFEGINQTIKNGGNASGKTYHVPLIGDFKSFQSDANDRMKQGQNPLLNIGQAALGTAGAGLDTVMGLDAGAKGVAKAGKFVADLGEKNVWEMIKPELTKTGAANAAKAGKLTEGGISGAAKPTVDKELLSAAKPYVKGAKSPLQAVTRMQGGIEQEATRLQHGLKQTGASYTKSQVQGALNKIEASPEIVGDVEKIYEKVKDKMVSLVGDGGTLDKLLQARKQFDSYITKSFPSLYSSERLSPMKKAVLDIRGAINDVIESRLPEGKLPSGRSFRDSLKHQRLLYDAIDNAASKVKVNQPTTNVGKAGALIKGAIKGAATYEGAKRIFTGHF